MEDFIFATTTDISKYNDQFIYEIEQAIDNSTSTVVTRTLRLYDIFIPLLGFFIITLNLIVVISSGLILKKGRLHPKSTYLFLGNVALADLVTGCAVLFGQFYPSHYRDENSCAIQIGKKNGPSINHIKRTTQNFDLNSNKIYLFFSL